MNREIQRCGQTISNLRELKKNKFYKHDILFFYCYMAYCVLYIIHIRLENKNIFSSFFKILLQQFLYPTRFHKRSSLVLKFDSFVTQSGTLSLSTCEKCRYCSIFGHFKINFKSWFKRNYFLLSDTRTLWKKEIFKHFSNCWSNSF